MANTVRNVLITGGTSGIGFEVARRLSNEEHNVALFDICPTGLTAATQKLSGMKEAWTRTVDVCDAEQVTQAVRALEAERGPVEILVNNVGGSTVRVPAHEMTADTFDEIVALNLRSTFLCTKAVMIGMRENGWGRIVNVASVAGRSHALFTNSNAAYVAAKAGVIGFTKQCAAECAPFGIAVNAVAFGPIATDRVLSGWKDRDDDAVNDFLHNIPAGRFGQVGEAAAAVCYLCSEDAGYTVGAVIDVNGGLYM